MCVERVHPQVLAVGGGCWDIKFRYIPNRNQGTAINTLLDASDENRYDHLSGAYDACVRVKVIKA